jgi:lipopolysaccharide transport system permease protein
MVWSYQDALAFGEIRHPLAWAAYGLGALGAFYVGYRAFRKMKIGFGDAL